MPDTIVLPNQKKVTADKPSAPSKQPMENLLKPLSTTKTETVTTSSRRSWSPKKKLAMSIGLAVLLFVVVVGSAAAAVGLYAYGVAQKMKNDVNELKVAANAVKDNLKTQNLPGARTALTDVSVKLQTTKSDFNQLKFLKFVPVAAVYYSDGEHGFVAAEAGVRAAEKTLDAIVPYADILGFSGEGSFTGGAAEERVRLLLETLTKVTPVFDDITAELKIVETELAQINPNRYPEKIQDFSVRDTLAAVQAGTRLAVDGMAQYRPALEILPEIAGNTERKKFLVIFQNDNELRPTGGFMTAYATMFVEKGKVYPEQSGDIYEIDNVFKSRIPIPEILGRYLTSEKYWNLRDMNIDPDFRVSMETFMKNYNTMKNPIGDLDGIITLDTTVLADLVKILGPVKVEGKGEFTGEIDERCDCPHIIYQLSEIVDRPTPYIREDRKGIIAPMMQEIIKKSYSAPKELWPQLFALAQQKIEGKHIQMYFFDDKYQQAAEAVNIAGRMKEVRENHDYLAIVDANLGGAKSNLFVDSEITNEVTAVENGQITKTVTVKYTNDFPASNCNLEAGQLCLNGTLNNWVRFYVPKGSKLIEAQGFTNDNKTEEYDEVGFHVMEGAMRLSPKSSATIVVKYTVPYTDETTYRVDIRKQAGTDPWKYLMDVNGSEEELILDKDKTYEAAF